MKRNARSLDTIADEINQLSRRNIIEIGDRLLEAKAQCDHGQWGDWLDSEFEWSEDTAENYMKVAKLSGKFRNFRNLRLAKTTLYQLADHEKEEEIPAIIEELAKHATKTRLVPRDAERVVKIGVGRYRFGDHPDATLVALGDLDEYGGTWRERAVAALLERKPTTDEAAAAIIDEAKDAIFRDLPERDDQGDEAKDESDEIGRILDGAPPEPPPPTNPPEPQKLSTETGWAEASQFYDAVSDLHRMRGKPTGRFVGQFAPEELRAVAEFLMAVAAADNKSKGADGVATPNGAGGTPQCSKF